MLTFIARRLGWAIVVLWFVMSGHTLARGTIMVSYQR